jgi:hypothetical protein
MLDYFIPTALIITAIILGVIFNIQGQLKPYLSIIGPIAITVIILFVFPQSFQS